MYVCICIFFYVIKKYVQLCTHRGLFKVQDGGQRVPTAGPRGDKPRGSWDRHGGVGGHLLVHTQLLQRRKTLTKNRHCRTQCTSLRNKEVCNGRSHTWKTYNHISVFFHRLWDAVRLIIRVSVMSQCYLFADSEQTSEWSDRLVRTQMTSLHVPAAHFSVLMKPGRPAHNGVSFPASQNVELSTAFCPLRKKWQTLFEVPGWTADLPQPSAPHHRPRPHCCWLQSLSFLHSGI